MVGSAKTALWRKWVSSSESSTFTRPVVAHLCGKGEQHLANSCPPPSDGFGSAGSPHRRLMSLLTDHYFQSGHVEGLTAEPVINKAEEWGWPVGDKESCLWREQKARGWNHHNDAAAHSWVMIAAGGAAGNSTAAAAHLLSWVASNLFPQGSCSCQAEATLCLPKAVRHDTHALVPIAKLTRDIGEVGKIWQV